MMKKISLFCLIAVMIMTSVVCVPIALATETETVSESSEVKFLKAIGILDDYLAMNTPVTRGVFAKYVARLYGEVPASTAAAQNYYDVTTDADYCSGISLLTQVGLLNGYGDGTFRPERPVNLTEAAKVTVDLLGYKYIANLNGGYPTGYAIAAQNLGLLKGLDTNQTYFYGEDLARLIYNAIDVDILMENGVIKGDGESSVNMQKAEGHTILTEKLDMYKGEGVVYANAITNLNGASVNKNQIWIDNFAVTVEDSQYFDMVGCPVEYIYYQADDSTEKVLVYAEVDKNSVLSLTKETFLGLDGLKITYSDANGKVKKANLDTNVKFVYNGDVVAFDSSYITGFNKGAITLVDSDLNGSYDVVKIENYISFVVDSVNATTNIADEGMKVGSASLDLTEDKYTIMQILNADGAEITVDSILKGNTISYYKSSGDKYLKVYVSKSIADGTLKSIGTSGGSTVYEIAEKLYPIPAGYTGDTANIGDAITAYLDVFGYIAGIEMGVDDGFIAGFLLTGKYDANGFNERYGFKIYNAQNKTITVYAEDKIDYNGVSTEIKNLPASLPQGIICYKLNEEGTVVAIETPTSDRATYEDGRLLTIFPKGTSSYYSRMFDSKYIFDDTSVVFKMPEQYDSQGNQLFPEYTDSKINAITYNDMEDRTSHTIEAYTLSSEAPRLKAVIIYDNDISSVIPRGENLATVISATSVLDENGMDVYQAHVMVEGVEKKLTLAETITEYKETIVNGVAVGSTSIISRSSLKPGDTFRYGTNSDGEIDKLEIVYTIADGWKYTWYNGQSVNEPNAQLAYGKVISDDGMFTRIMFDDESYSGFVQDYYAIPQSHYGKVTVLTIGARGCTVTAGSIKDAVAGDYVINYRNLMAAVGFVIIKDQR
ncbi:MAG: S-layer homology domain-containing protein [Clostridia bacterium]|nr:S-layer homology domain-containing protein [Clostridia bacterium]